jgi:N-acetyl-gamma-glutamyl-phosphate/LysW-gamma-L-alpha-aminoadipyl-6-phosphate reductase
VTTPVWIVGSSGLLAGELARLLEGHDQLELRGAVSRTGGVPLRGAHPGLTTSVVTSTLEEALVELRAALEAGPVALFLGLPHGESAAAWNTVSRELGDAAAQLRVVDLSADFRLADVDLFEAAYGTPHPDPEGAEGFVYGLPELDREGLVGATRVAAPGCFATALQLATVPAARAGLLDASAPHIYSGVTGSSGSGAAPLPTTHHPHRHGNFKAYAPGGHRHEAELAQALRPLGPVPPIHFLPHSGPFSRGIHLSASLPLARPTSAAEVHAVFGAALEGEPFVEVLPLGACPELRTVVGSNRASLAVHVRGEQLTVLVTIDNTIKGGAGQALQNMNLMLGLPETAGLPRAGLGVL